MRHDRSSRRGREAAALALGAVLLAGGCGLSAGRQPEPGLLPPIAADSARIEAQPSQPRPSGKQFGDEHQFADGVHVRVKELVTAVLGRFPSASNETLSQGEPYTVIRVQLDNHGRRKFHAAFEARVRFGSDLTEADRVWINQVTDTDVEPGESVSHDFGFVIPDEYLDDVVFELSVDPRGHRRTNFVGTVRTS